MDSEQHTFNLDRETFLRLQEHSKRKKVSMSALLRLLINENCGFTKK
jgi:hypothetical protein